MLAIFIHLYISKRTLEIINTLVRRFKISLRILHCVASVYTVAPTSEFSNIYAKEQKMIHFYWHSIQTTCYRNSSVFEMWIWNKHRNKQTFSSQNNESRLISLRNILNLAFWHLRNCSWQLTQKRVAYSLYT